MIRIGQGYDAHRFKDGGDLILGGVKIDSPRGMAAHSDGDVVLHAVCDALLGAAGMGDIGKHFPDTDDRYKGIDSRFLLREVKNKLTEKHFQTINLDVTIIAQAPKMAPHINQMVTNISDDLAISPSQCNVKATTTEEMGFEGRGEGIAVQAVALIQQV